MIDISVRERRSSGRAAGWASLHGLVDFEAVGLIDSKHGGIRITFTDVADAPISKVVVDMEGAKKGPIVNSTNPLRGKAPRQRPP